MVARDQAYQLRNLVRQMAPRAADPGRPRHIVVTGGRSGVGTTTMAVNLAVAVAQQGRRVTLVDANLQHANVAALCGIEANYTICDVLRGERNVREVLQSGPAGIRVLAGTRAFHRDVECTPEAQQRLLNQLASMRCHSDFVVLDIGCALGEIASRFWSASDQVVLVTTGHPDSVVEACASIELPLDREAPIPLMYAVANQTVGAAAFSYGLVHVDPSDPRASELNIRVAGHVLMDDQCAAAACAGVPLLIHSPASPAARSIQRLAALLAASDSPSEPKPSASAFRVSPHG